MNRRVLVAAVAGLSVAGLLVVGCTDHEHGYMKDGVALTSTPPAVQSAIKSAVGTGKLESVKKETDDGKTVYEAEFEVADVDHSVKVSETGQILEEEVDIDLKDLPPAVKAAVIAKYPKATLEEAKTVREGSAMYYEVEIEVGNAARELNVDATGKILEDEAETEKYQETDKK